ncbi:MAG: hypothetical protein KJ000_29580 [Pirellulaceae bacterium]|nr:hypothetical protein [Pirellulaceae bacterium]
MKFFFPDSHDLVDPSFDFQTETRSEHRIRHRNDQYAHELFEQPPYSGMLVSKAIVDGTEKGAGKYTVAQRHRLLRQGVREFFRIGDRPLETMGDCGAFSYVREEYPPYSVEEVIDFYLDCQIDYGVSVDHVILAFQSDEAAATEAGQAALAGYRQRQAITLDLAREFLALHKRRKLPFTPLGVAQGWSPASYAAAVRDLQKMGYSYIGVGGLVPLQSADILASLKAIDKVRRVKTGLHLFGVNRCEHLDEFRDFGVVSFDSTSPLLQAFKHDRDNYYTESCKYSAIRVPQVEGNAKLGNRIRAGEINQEAARKLELACLKALTRFDEQGGSVPQLLKLLRDYDLLHDGRKDRSEDYGRTLQDRPWATCPCQVCRDLGIHVVIFRGAERNRRRGFHNLYVTYHHFHKSV